jgi:hypothetical protein
MVARFNFFTGSFAGMTNEGRIFDDAEYHKKTAPTPERRGGVASKRRE